MLRRYPVVCKWTAECIKSERLFTTTTCTAARYNSNKNIRSGVPKITQNRSKKLTYEQANYPFTIGNKKAWNSWNTSNLHGETTRTAETTVEDMFIRKFMAGTWHQMFKSEVIIKRRQNMIVIAGLVVKRLDNNKFYFLQGYTEELLSFLLKRPVKVEIQTIQDAEEMVFKRI